MSQNPSLIATHRISFPNPTLVCAVLLVLLMGRSTLAAEYTVRADGAGSFPTIQACANAALPGDTCLVQAGTYPEHVKTAAGGTGDDNRVTFKAQGVVTMRGFEVRHPFVSIDGFDMTGYAIQWDGLITVYSGGSGCAITNNTLHDGSPDVMGIYFYISSGKAANNCVVRGNRLSNLRYMFITTGGSNHLFENNTLEYQNNMDFVRLFGSGHIFRRNVFRYAGDTAVSGNHPDFSQTFGQNDTPSENHLFEQNWIGDLKSQFGQYNSGGITAPIEPYNNYKNVTFRQNIIFNLAWNGNFSFPGVRFERNTFYRFAYELSGLMLSGSVARGEASNTTVAGNVFLAGGTIADSGYYWLDGALFSREVIGVFITNDPLQSSSATSGIYTELQTRGYIDSNGKILAAARSLTDVSQFVLSTAFASYRQAIYDRLTQTVRMDASIRSTFSADYNYVAGAASAGFPAKRSSGCIPSATFTEWNFCEPHGVNGGDPLLRSLTNLLGPDGIPFTLDDGLKPLPTSRLCGAGPGGSDIGAYSCDPSKVFGYETPAAQPPSNLRLISGN